MDYVLDAMKDWQGLAKKEFCLRKVGSIKTVYKSTYLKRKKLLAKLLKQEEMFRKQDKNLTEMEEYMYPLKCTAILQLMAELSSNESSHELQRNKGPYGPNNLESLIAKLKDSLVDMILTHNPWV
tara:strand:+ start:1664 stop:2038 length:375 start_codon:yes stop_codon:yes gene_type:complete